jgi:apolipoprotein N-acyltransferase
MKNTDYIIFPETYFKENIWLNDFSRSNLYEIIKNYSHRKRLKVIAGIFLKYESNNSHNQMNNGLIDYSHLNTAIQIDSTKSIPIKVKKIYVPIQEFLPEYFNLLSESSANYGKMESNNDYFENGEVNSFIAICYEAVNGIFLSERWNNHNVIFMLASEGFLNGNKEGMRQYLNISRIRSIEMSKYIFKSSNSGLSAVIDERGNIVKISPANDLVNIVTVSGFTNNSQTFYSNWGWLMNRLIILIFFSFLLIVVIHKTLSN